MCSPTAMMVAQGGNALLGGFAQRSAIKQANRARQQIAKREASAATEALMNQMKMVAQRETQQDYATMQQLREAQVEAYFAEGQQAASQAAAGVEGLSVEDLNQEARMVETLRYGAIETQRDFDQVAMENQKQQLQAQAQSRINAAQQPNQPLPNMLGTLFNVGMAGASGYLSGVGYDPEGNRVNAFTGDRLD